MKNHLRHDSPPLSPVEPVNYVENGSRGPIVINGVKKSPYLNGQKSMGFTTV